MNNRELATIVKLKEKHNLSTVTCCALILEACFPELASNERLNKTAILLDKFYEHTRSEITEKEL